MKISDKIKQDIAGIEELSVEKIESMKYLLDCLVNDKVITHEQVSKDF